MDQRIYLTKGVKLHAHLRNLIVRFNSATLICRSTDISKCFRGSLRLRDNESRLYFKNITYYLFAYFPLLNTDYSIPLYVTKQRDEYSGPFVHRKLKHLNNNKNIR